MAPVRVDSRPADTITSDPRVFRAQTLLAGLGFDPGPMDGLAGPRTMAALDAFREQAGLEGRPDILDDAVLDAMEAAHPTATVAEVQRRLSGLGFDVGPDDGRIGPRTRAAIRQFQLSADLPVDGYLTPDLLDSLRVVAVASLADPMASDGLLAGMAVDEPPAEGSTPEPEPGDVPPESVALTAIGGEPKSRMLAPGDRIAIAIRGDAQPAAYLAVADDGTVTVPGLGPLDAAGMTVTELEKIVAVRLLENYLRELSVRIDVAEDGENAETTAR